MNNQKKKNVLFLVLKSMVSIGLLTWFFISIDWMEALTTIKNGKPMYLFLAFLAIQLTVLSSVWKWKLTIHTFEEIDHSSIKFSYLSRLYYIGLFFNNFLPSSIGGDVMRIFYLGQKIGNVKASTSVAFERLTSGLAMLVIILVGALFFDKIRPFLTSIYLFIGILLVFLLLFIWFFKKYNGESQANNKWLLKSNRVLLDFRTSLRPFKQAPISWWISISLLSVAFQLGMAWINQLLFKSFGLDVPFYQLLVFITFISIITMLPISVNGLGVREASYVLFFKEIGMLSSISVSVSLLFFLLVAISSLCGGLFWLTERRNEDEVIRQ